MKLKEGVRFPDFSLLDDQAKEFRLNRDVNTKYTVLYFYPKDETPGCTKQACFFRDSYNEFKEYDCEVIGISSDRQASHERFKSNHNLPFKLLSDVKGKLRKQLELPKDFLGLSPGRITFLINSELEILFIFRSSLNMESHISSVLTFLKK